MKPQALTSKTLLWYIRRGVLTLLAFHGMVCLYILSTGFPARLPFLNSSFKNMRTPCIIALALIVVYALFEPQGPIKGLGRLRDKLDTRLSHPAAIYILFAFYALLFAWQQLTEYLSLRINFLPFSIFDAMLYYFSWGKINYSGALHEYYHINNILYLLWPVWRLFKDPLVLILIYGPLASLAALPLYHIAKDRLKEPAIAFLIALLYLNYRYLQNILQMNFCIEIFYPLFLFAALDSALKRKWVRYYSFLFLGLSVKEDSFIYFTALGFLTSFLHQEKGHKFLPSSWPHGLATILLSFAYFLFVTHIFIPMTGNTILKGDLENFGSEHTSAGGFFLSLLKKPALILDALFGSWEKGNTYLNLGYRLGFAPFFTPAALLVLFPILPLFLHNTGWDADFIRLHFHYAGAVIPFVFIAFIYGISNISTRISPSRRKDFLWIFFLILLFVNGGNYRSEKISKENLSSIRGARSVPEKANLVTHGHLLPYVGYREYNYYFGLPWENPEHPYFKPYHEADYYLFDFHVNPYPIDQGYLDKKVGELMRNPDYELIRQDLKRFLFKRKSYVE